MKRILICGGCGYIGSELFCDLCKDHDVTSVDLEWFGRTVDNICLDYDDLTENFLNNFDVVILTAAHSSVGMCKKDPIGSLDNNVMRWLKLTKKLNKQKFIYASSSCVYDSVYGATEFSPTKATDDLSLTKITIDSYTQFSNFNVEYYGLRFGSVNGPSKNFRNDLMINRMSLDSQNKTINLANSHCHRPILAMSDLVSAVRKIVESNEDKRGLYNIASFNESIGNIANQVSAEFDSQINLISNTPSTFDFTMSSEKFSQAFNWEPSIKCTKDLVNDIKLSLSTFKLIGGRECQGGLK